MGHRKKSSIHFYNKAGQNGLLQFYMLCYTAETVNRGSLPSSPIYIVLEYSLLR